MLLRLTRDYLPQTYRWSYVLCTDRYREGQLYYRPSTIRRKITFDEVAPFLEGKTLVGHNLTFDLGWLYKYNFVPKRVYDTFIASKILYNGNGLITRHGFGFVMERELGINYDKSEQKNIAKTHLLNLKLFGMRSMT